MIGQTLGDGRYRILKVLGEGGMGAVYEAEHTGTGRRVAIKVILRAQLARHPELVQRFEREARAAGSIDTQHIAQVLDAGTDAATSTPYLVMELLKGEDMEGLLDRLGPLPPDLALRLVGQAAIGLLRAHETGVVHRDVKPANLFLSRREDGAIIVKVVDFGVVKIKNDVTGSRDNSLTRTGSMLGSPRYMSPEQALGKKTIDHRTDVWSLGVVLYELLAGDVPHVDAETLGALIMAICSEPARPLREVAPWVSPDVAALVHRTLHIAEDDRLESMEAFLDQIRALLPDGDVSVRADMLVALSTEERARRHQDVVGARSLVRSDPPMGPAQTSSPPPQSSMPPPAPLEPLRPIGRSPTQPEIADDPTEPVPSRTMLDPRDEARPSRRAPLPLVKVLDRAAVSESSPESSTSSVKPSRLRPVVGSVAAGACVVAVAAYAIAGMTGKPRVAPEVTALPPMPETATAAPNIVSPQLPVPSAVVSVAPSASAGTVPSVTAVTATPPPRASARPTTPAAGAKPPNNGMTRKFE